MKTNAEQAMEALLINNSYFLRSTLNKDHKNS